MPASRASSTASEVGAETAAMIGIAKRERLLDDLERDAAGDHQHAAIERDIMHGQPSR